MSLYDAVVNLEETVAVETVEKLYSAGTDPLSILDECRRALGEVGNRFQRGEYFVSELILSADIFQKIMRILEPALAQGKNQATALGTVVIGTVKGDIHDLGKNLVVAQLKANGFDVIDLGVDVPKEKFVDAIREIRPHVLGLSVLLTVSFEAMRDTIRAIEQASLRDGLKIIIGGGLVDDKVRAFVNADAVGKDAVTAVELAKQFAK